MSGLSEGVLCRSWIAEVSGESRRIAGVRILREGTPPLKLAGAMAKPFAPGPAAGPWPRALDPAGPEGTARHTG